MHPPFVFDTQGSWRLRMLIGLSEEVPTPTELFSDSEDVPVHQTFDSDQIAIKQTIGIDCPIKK